jgi:transketolase
MGCRRLRKTKGGRDQRTGVTARVSIEMASTVGWDRYVGPKGKMIGMHSFGASAPLKDLLNRFGFNADAVVAAAKQVLGK